MSQKLEHDDRMCQKLNSSASSGWFPPRSMAPKHVQAPSLEAESAPRTQLGGPKRFKTPTWRSKASVRARLGGPKLDFKRFRIHFGPPEGSVSKFFRCVRARACAHDAKIVPNVLLDRVARRIAFESHLFRAPKPQNGAPRAVWGVSGRS